MACSSCGYESDPAHRFCTNCGQQFAQGCVQCGTPLPPGARFCATCGTAVGEAAASTARVEAPAAQLEETVAFLGNLPIFQSLSREGLTRLAENMELRSFAEGPILRENDPARGLHIIKSGAAKVTKSSEAGGTEAVLAILKPGDSFGEIGLIDDMPASADVSAMQPVECYTLGWDVFFGVLDEHPEIARGMLQVLAGMVRNADEWIARAI